ncbi:hypothetical protein [Kushneria aurantia]|uniref:Chain-length determining protein n=1 Tax=Kushneria aurantia TaxID=504092 RepID=A0ABV6G3J3_9GAMM|nr:hypothetical protein [Kushneria aurantia]
MKNTALLKRYPHWWACLVAIVLATLYWGLLASDRYVSHANVVLQSPQISTPEFNVSSLLSGGGGGNNTADMLLLRDYMLSTDMLQYLVENADFRQHYAHSGADFLSALGNENAPLEKLYDYYQQRVSVEMDNYAGVLRIDVQAFTPEKANQIANMLIAQGEQHMNAMGRRLAEEQVQFLEQQVSQLEQRFEQARQNLLEYQNEEGLVSPTGTVESLSSVVASLEGQLASLKAQRSALSSYQSTNSPQMTSINSQINALEQQIEQEQQRLAAQSGNALNAVSSQYQLLQLRAQFAQQSYSGALGALENTRIEAARKLKQVSLLQEPTMPEFAELPERVYNIAVFAVIALFITLIVNMLILIIRDHRD